MSKLSSLGWRRLIMFIRGWTGYIARIAQRAFRNAPENSVLPALCPFSLKTPHGQPTHFALFLAASASLRVASSSSAVSMAWAGRWTYRTTEPRMNMSLVEHCRLMCKRPEGRVGEKGAGLWRKVHANVPGVAIAFRPQPRHCPV